MKQTSRNTESTKTKTNNKFILVGNKIVPETDLLKWAVWFEASNRIVARTKIGDYVVSTVFLGMNHRFFGEGKPLLFETLAWRAVTPELRDFDLQGHSQRLRTSTWDEAISTHAEEVKLIAGNIARGLLKTDARITMGSNAGHRKTKRPKTRPKRSR